jgi:hypothetical protein
MSRRTAFSGKIELDPYSIFINNYKKTIGFVVNCPFYAQEVLYVYESKFDELPEIQCCNLLDVVRGYDDWMRRSS